MLKNIAAAAVLALAALPAVADDIDLEGGTQKQFKSISEDLVATINYKALGPAEAGGLTGFSLGVVGTYVSVDDEDAWEAATGEDVSALGMVGVSATKGLPFDIDVGLFYATAPGVEVDVLGGEIRYAILAGSTVSPAIAVRLAHAKLSGIDNWDLDSTSLDVSVSKGFTLLTPYGGIGRVWGTSDPDFGTLKKEDVEELRLFAGLKISLGLIDFTPEYERLGDNNAYSLKAGLSF